MVMKVSWLVPVFVFCSVWKSGLSQTQTQYTGHGQLPGGRTIAFECVGDSQVFLRSDNTKCTCVGPLQATCTKETSNIIGTSRSLDLANANHPNRLQVSQAIPINHDHETQNTKAHQFSHPLDPLTADEILKASEILRGTFRVDPGRFRFNVISLKEPPKRELLKYFLKNTNPPTDASQRKAFVILLEVGSGHIYEAVVNLSQSVVESFVRAEDGSRPMASVEMAITVRDVVMADSEVQERCRRLGFSDMKLVAPEALPLQKVDPRDRYANSTNPVQVYMFGRLHATDNYYAHPFDFVVIVDETTKKVMGIEDLPSQDHFTARHPTYRSYDDHSTRIPKESANFDKIHITGDKPVKIEMPEGASYRVNGNEVIWQKFKFRIGFSPREGLILHNIGYLEDSGAFRPILYRASLTEVATVYGDPRPPFHRKYAFDEGNIGFGFATTPLKDQEDCIGRTYFFDVTTNNATGHPFTVPKGICMYEDDAGILWKHAPNRYTDEGNYVVRSHRLNILTAANFGNYDYLLTWMFHQDGSISLKTQLTGILSTNWVSANATGEGFGTIVAPQIDAQYHQHVFAVRLDFEIDGNKNTVHSVEAVPFSEPSGSPNHILGQGFTTRKHFFKKQGKGCSKINPLSGKNWIVTNPEKIHPYTKSPVGWKLMAVVDPEIMMSKNSPIFTQMGFLQCDVWVTKYEDDQVFAGGYYLNNSGLPQWVTEGKDKSIENTDIVVWTTFNPVHIPRVEDYPVMPVESRELWIKPYNFFNRNPALP